MSKDMSRAYSPAEIKAALAQGVEQTRSVLFVWLTSEPAADQEYVEVSNVLMEAGERNLAHLVVHRGLAIFPSSDKLALCALNMELRRGALAA